MALVFLPVVHGLTLPALSAADAQWPATGVIFIDGQIFHLWLIHRHLTR